MSRLAKAEWRRAGRRLLGALAAALAIVAATGTSARSAPVDGRPVEEPSGYRLNDYRAPVPPTLKGARVIGAEDARALLNAKAALFIDVYPRPPKPEGLPEGTLWREPTHETIPGAVWLPNTGYGVLAPAVEDYFRSELDRLTGGDRGRALVFFCQRDCWMSWNAAKRALALGYTNVTWFPDGTDGWQDLGESLVKAEPAH